MTIRPQDRDSQTGTARGRAAFRYSLATIRRVQRHPVAHDYLEKVTIDRGWASTRRRIVLEKLGLRHTSSAAVTPQPSPHDTAQEHTHRKYSWLFSGWARRDHSPTRSTDTDASSPSQAPLAATPAGETTAAMALDWAAAAGGRAPLVSDVCEHGGRAGLMRSGLPWCSDCRARSTRQRA